MGNKLMDNICLDDGIALDGVGISKSFHSPRGKLDVLSGINVKLAKGETLAIVGPSGCGKSTLLRIIAGLESTDSGSIACNPRVQKNGIAYIQQTPHLLPWRTVLQNAVLGLEIRTKVGQLHRDQARFLLQDFGLMGFEHALPAKLSGGMKQKAALVCALLANPGLLLCDEPFSAIDFVARLHLLKLFKNRCSIIRASTIIVTHNIEEAVFLGDRVMVLSGRPATLVSNHKIDLGIEGIDPVRCRSTVKFQNAFHAIWEDLKHAI